MTSRRAALLRGALHAGMAVAALVACTAYVTARGATESDKATRAQLEEGRALFLREWLPDDPRSSGGDGLGPVYNDSSCVACHNSGAPGGAGPNSKNVDILSAAANAARVVDPSMLQPRKPRFVDQAMEALLGIDQPKLPAPAAPTVPLTARRPKLDRGPLVAFHPGFRTANSIVLHRFSTETGYESWRTNAIGMGQFGFGSMMGNADNEINMHRSMAQMEQNIGQFQNSVGSFLIARSQRNPTALFGAGLIDSIPEDVLVEQAKKRFAETPEVAGRVSRLKDGRIGRFGWKGQTPSLNDFVLTACAVELGLEVPDHAQGGLPSKPHETAKGLDLTAEQCASLAAYVRNLPKPSQVNVDSDTVKSGSQMFAKIGCANCHTQKLGEVDGIYSDLLLHDMGQDLGDTGQYGVFVPDSSEPEIEGEQAPGGLSQHEQAAPADTPADAVAQVEAGPQIALPPGSTVQTVSFQVGMGGMGGASAMGVGPSGVALNRPKDGPASRQEWRTPPLWGLRDSGPYMHDGRAATLERAIALHGGEGTTAARKYFGLSPKERLLMQSFLKSLAAPTSDGVEVAANR